MTPQQELQLVMSRLHAQGGGIVLFHDTKSGTAAMLPAFLKQLKDQGYRVVHVVATNPRQVALLRPLNSAAGQ